MRNPGYIYELAAMYLAGAPEVFTTATRNRVDHDDLDDAIEGLRPLTQQERETRIHDLYVSDAVEKGYAEGAAGKPIDHRPHWSLDDRRGPLPDLARLAYRPAHSSWSGPGRNAAADKFAGALGG